MKELGAVGVTVLGDQRPAGSPGFEGRRMTEVEGLRIAGFSDPFEWRGVGDLQDRPITFDALPDPDAAINSELTGLTRSFDRLPKSPDVVMIHQSGLARSLAATLAERGYRNPLTIVTGHDHQQRVDGYGQIVVVDAGTVGAGGAFEAGQTSIGFVELHFDERSSRLNSVALMAIEPFTGRAQASRVVIDSLCPETDRCSYEPAEVEPRALDQ